MTDVFVGGPLAGARREGVENVVARGALSHQGGGGGGNAGDGELHGDDRDFGDDSAGRLELCSREESSSLGWKGSAKTGCE